MSKSISVDIAKPFVFEYIKELAQKNIIIEQEKKTHAVISIQKLPDKKNKENNSIIKSLLSLLKKKAKMIYFFLLFILNTRGLVNKLLLNPLKKEK